MSDEMKGKPTVQDFFGFPKPVGYGFPAVLGEQTP